MKNMSAAPGRERYEYVVNCSDIRMAAVHSPAKTDHFRAKEIVGVACVLGVLAWQWG